MTNPITDALKNLSCREFSTPGFVNLAEWQLIMNLIRAAGKIPDKPSPAHYLSTPGWPELKAAFVALAEVVNNRELNPKDDK